MLGIIPYLYLGITVLAVATGSGYLICRYDPFVGFFRLGASFNMFVAGGILLLSGAEKDYADRDARAVQRLAILFDMGADRLRVQEELETLARNEAPSAGANAVQAAAAPADGSQRFAAFQCPPR